MIISDVYSAEGLKFNLMLNDSAEGFSCGDIVRIESTQNNNYFMLTQYNISDLGEYNSFLCYANQDSSDYILELLERENEGVLKCLFIIEGIGEKYLMISAYTFNSITEYKTPIYIQVPSEVLKKVYIKNEKEYTEEELKRERLNKLKTVYTCTQFGEPAIFSACYRDRKKDKNQVRFVSGRNYLFADNTPRGIFVKGEYLAKDRGEMPVDIYIAPQIEFVEDMDSYQANNEFVSDLDKISDTTSFLSQWEAYNQLSEYLIQKESEEFGKIKYTSYNEKVDLLITTYTFDIDQEIDDSFIGKDVGVVPEGLDENDKNWDKPSHVGTIIKINKTRITTKKENAEDIAIPTKGILVLFTLGDKSVIKRRNVAKKRMLDKKTPIPTILALIEKGGSSIATNRNWKINKAFTNEFYRKFPKARSLNEKQRLALETAINTPDIAIIQGPPGTGKTTVIKAICERFKELFEEEEIDKQKKDADYPLNSPTILISSFQNDAVDNAISAPSANDIPAYRKLAQRSKNSSLDQYQKALSEWYNNISELVAAKIDNKATQEYTREKQILDDMFLSYKNSKESLEKAALLIKRYLGYEAIKYPDELVNQANQIIKKGLQSDIEEEIDDPIVAKLESQRLTPKAFEDDGERNAKRLLAHLRLRDDLDIDGGILESINAVCSDDYTEDTFRDYITAIKKLKSVYCSNNKKIDVNDKKVINKCISQMRNAFENQYTKQFTDTESKKSLILSEFIMRLEQESEMVVKKYSITTAATCQTSLEFRDIINEQKKEYDLVIIDEAARANPLDLFIPMSMGKKIIMVGDQKQLPHMLEPDVVKFIRKEYKDITGLEESMFERMFNMFMAGDKPRSVMLTQQYRMHPDICRFVSTAFYDGILETPKELIADPTFRISPKEINNGKALTLVNLPLSCGAEKPGASKSRMCEVVEICKDIRKILDIESNPKVTIGIITFYSAQVKLINDHLILNDEEKDRIEIGTVDAFQGKEFDYVLLSCVRSNTICSNNTHDVGFLDKPNRLCVAFSRARKQLAVYGDIETLMQIPCFEQLYNICAIEGGGFYREC